ncbi:single-stranded-DNA-specific exonuclease RecJ [Candidatus Pantoea edessiphila]|uniref:Single-stranded-DNA-specific exonuclease RecJ n=1 Tax=Candidatus Pantoea edessiphila TaxID=2044610 RepID=A0A2P5SXK3_9GAMM|nr:single-stranded-DNA-specific exonuclease RecJ [Candidatus Pantoea edessiphila]MBK4775698.1 single-stranded-DNA-specific exonuclease RecJ [Pantoea sp. Edef]PPI87071.1 single-stranded-DNA-specific exonuclease RecJ [Candidatus Pantoea edessiphila]
MLNYKIILRRRKATVKDSLPTHLPPLIKRIYLNRGVCDPEHLERSIKKLFSFKSLYDIDKAVVILHTMLVHNRKIIVVGDFDTDGATSTALTVLALRSMGSKNVEYLIPNRFKDGYGLSEQIVTHLHNVGADMILTVDNGISSHEGVKCAKKYNIPVIITDHHLPADQLPDAEAIINPNITRCSSLCSLAGVGVAFYLMIALRTYLRKQGWFNGKWSEPNLANLLDLVALGTIADVVPLDINNRILVWQGLIRIRSGICRPGIIALLELANRSFNDLSTDDLSYVLGPRLNAAGRLNDMTKGVALLLTDDLNQARVLSNELDLLNQTRKKIENIMQNEAWRLCNILKQKENNLPLGITVYHPKWHQGVVGIVASRLKERFRRPVIAFAPTGIGDGVLKGSGRSVENLHLRDILSHLNMLNPKLMIKFGGHSMAAGLSIKESDYDEFSQQFSIVVKKLFEDKLISYIVWSDGCLQPTDFSIQTAYLLREAGPWGTSFPEPTFDGKFELIRQRLINKRHLHVLLRTIDVGTVIDGMLFNVDTDHWPNNNINKVELVYRLDIKKYRSKHSVQLIIEYLWPLY